MPVPNRFQGLFDENGKLIIDPQAMGAEVSPQGAPSFNQGGPSEPPPALSPQATIGQGPLFAPEEGAFDTRQIDSGVGRVNESKRYGGTKSGFWEGIRNSPGAADALLAFGSQMLSAPDFFSGLGKGFQAAGQARDDYIQSRRPKSQLTADGAFTIQTDPITGQQRAVENPLISRYQRGLKEAEWGGKRELAELQGGMRSKDRALDRDLRREENAENREFRRQQASEARQARLDQIRLIAELRTSQGRPVPPKALADYTTIMNKVGDIDNTLIQIEEVSEKLNDGTLSLGPTGVIGHRLRMATGQSNEADLAYADMKQAIASMRNSKLLDAKGTQTEGDAVRALDEVVVSNFDPKVMARNFSRIQRGFEAAKQRYGTQMDIYSREYGIDEGGSSAPKAPNRSSMKAKYGLQ